VGNDTRAETEDGERKNGGKAKKKWRKQQIKEKETERNQKGRGKSVNRSLS